MNPSVETINKIDQLVDGFRRRGLAGHVVSVPIDKLAEGEQAAWTGAQYELAVVSTPTLPKIELRSLDNGLKTLVYEAADPRKYIGIMADFLAREG